ncbi:hypothetical protein M3Y99_01387400 [Aphelenchoides fujianensis]|nr:hypothetical protein M3Y99_01387400 [Aphelenchoides fujianensis]
MSAGGDDADFDDEFGDFEEAPATAIVEETKADVCDRKEEEIVESLPWSPPSIALQPIADVLADAQLWDLQTGVENVEAAAADDHELFAAFRFVSAELPATVESAANVWSHLRIGEGVSALQFQWNTSKSCAQFVAALPLHQRREGGSGAVDYRLDETPEVEHEYISLQSLSATQEYDAQKSNSGVNLDELNGSPSPAALDYKIFETSSRVNHGQSLLEQELGALGLVDADTRSPKSNGTSHRSKESPARTLVHRPRYLCVDDLNQDAQLFYEQMPDLQFMLSASRVER